MATSHSRPITAIARTIQSTIMLPPPMERFLRAAGERCRWWRGALRDQRPLASCRRAATSRSPEEALRLRCDGAFTASSTAYDNWCDDTSFALLVGSTAIL